MAGDVFTDTNVLVYSRDTAEPEKQRKARAWMTHLWTTRQGRLSYQVLQEFYVNVTAKIGKPLSRSAAREVVQSYGRWVENFITPVTVVRASEISEIWQLSFWDSMIVATAEQDGAAELLSEDLSHGQTIAGVRISNPFVVA